MSRNLSKRLWGQQANFNANILLILTFLTLPEDAMFRMSVQRSLDINVCLLTSTLSVWPAVFVKI